MAAGRCDGREASEHVISDDEIQRVLRARLMTLVVAATGPTTLAASASGGAFGGSAFTRPAGSFITDGFRVGMEVVPTGFPVNVRTTITSLSASVMTVKDLLATSAAAAGRSLTVGVPHDVAWENITFDSTTGRPYMEEQYISGSGVRVSASPQGKLSYTPTYVINTYVPGGVGGSADALYVDALRDLFMPDTAMPLANGDILKVRSDVVPYRGQRNFSVAGWVAAPFTIPLRVQTYNSI